MTKYLTIKRIIMRPGGRIYEPGLLVDIPLSDECERILTEKKIIKQINRERIKTLAEVMENDTDNRRNKRQRPVCDSE